MNERLVIEEKFFKLLQIAVGNKPETVLEISEDEWSLLYKVASKQSLTGIILSALDKITSAGGQKPSTLFIIAVDWRGRNN